MLKLPVFKPLSFEERLRQIRLASILGNKFIMSKRRGGGAILPFDYTWNFDDGTAQGWSYTAGTEISSSYYHSSPYGLGIYATVSNNRSLFRHDLDFNGQTQSLLDFWFHPRNLQFNIYWLDKDADTYLLVNVPSGTNVWVHLGPYDITSYVNNDVGGDQGLRFWPLSGVGSPKFVYVDDIHLVINY
jgi:hypothetical protein